MSELSSNEIKTIELMIRDAIQQHLMVDKKFHKTHLAMHEKLEETNAILTRTVDKLLPLSLKEVRDEAAQDVADLIDRTEPVE